MIVHLPFPISTNAIWRSVRGVAIKSKPYREWQRTAGWKLKSQRVDKLQDGTPFHIDITLVRPRNKDGKPRKTRPDLDNCAKAILDLLVIHDVTPDDSLCQSLTMRWADAVEGPTVKVMAGG